MSNGLLNEKSPYLLQHAENPVDWYPWGDIAFKKADEENKPIFLSIGYSTCHWCHVMAHESFEDVEVAKLMNETFISIKVDREERPDIDGIYMTVCQMMTGQGGWPLTIIMTPDKKPFFAGTYFPKTSRFGRIGLIELINRIKELWISEKGKILESAEQVSLSLTNLTIEAPGGSLEKAVLKKAFKQLETQFDERNGGFGNRPKFPTPHNLLFLLRYWNRTKDNKALEMVEKTLQEMRKGGVYDQIGFGFHRYSTDSDWLVPHFEKMLYDQAMLVLAYSEAYQATGKDEYKTVANEILTYVSRDMTSPLGGFHSAEDADSEGEEGKFYVWSIDEVEKILGKEDTVFAIRIFNLKKQGNYLEEATRKETGDNILHLRDSLSNIASSYSLSVEAIEEKLHNIRERLFEIREYRIHPYKDDKILVDWNGLMIAAFAKAGQIFRNEEYLKIADKAVEFVLTILRRPDGRLLHRFRDGTAEIEAYLSDYAFLIWGLIELYEATFDVNYLRTAITLNDDLINHFWDVHIGGFYFTADDGEKLLTRQKEIYDGAIPSGNSVAMLNLLRLSYITGNYELEKKADILGRVFAESVSSNPIAYTMLMSAVDFAVGPTYSIVISGDSGDKDVKEISDTIRTSFIPHQVLLQRITDQAHPEIDEIANYVQFFEKHEDKPTAYICINKLCKPPINEFEKVIETLDPLWKK